MKLRNVPVLITSPAYSGSLAAVRALGNAGVRVTVGGDKAFAAARYSKFATNFWPLTTTDGVNGFLDDLRQQAKTSSGHILLAGSDELAWLFARYAKELAEDFNVYIPTLDTIETILDKKSLRDACRSIGIATLPSWFPDDLTALEECRDELQFPVLIKARRHIFDDLSVKGQVVWTHEALIDEYISFSSQVVIRKKYDAEVKKLQPMLQLFVEDAVENVVSISGFIDRSGGRSVLRASRKIFQRRRPIGVGLAFETIDVDPELASTAIRLCKSLGYFGVFEIEFVQISGVWCLIDFNPRFYQEMALEIAAGAPLPLLSYTDACDDGDALDRLVDAANAYDHTERLGFSDMFTTRVMMAVRMAVSPFKERKAILWHWRMRGRLVDAFFELRDPLPFFVHALSELWLCAARLGRMVKQTRPQAVAIPAAVVCHEAP